MQNDVDRAFKKVANVSRRQAYTECINAMLEYCAQLDAKSLTDDVRSVITASMAEVGAGIQEKIRIQEVEYDIMLVHDEPKL